MWFYHKSIENAWVLLHTCKSNFIGASKNSWQKLMVECVWNIIADMWKGYWWYSCISNSIFRKPMNNMSKSFLFYRRSIENEWVLLLHNQDKFPLEFHIFVDTSSWKQRSLEKGGNLIANILKIYGCYVTLSIQY